ncbi:MAG: (d)CMP kinase [Bacillota bacterium]
MERINIAIDGPAGAGKSTIAKAIAKELHILHLDTGAMYRTLALKALRLGIDPGDAVGVEGFLDDTDVRVGFENGVQTFWLDGEDVTGLIRTSEVSKGASDIAVIPAVRHKLVRIQRQIAVEHDVVMDGRDITTYVLKDAKYKFFVTASAEVRARRRLLEMEQKGLSVGETFEQVLDQIQKRDLTDSTRAMAPLRQAEDAVLVDTSSLSIEQAIEAVMDHIRPAR